jgi:hypothetical protein
MKGDEITLQVSNFLNIKKYFVKDYLHFKIINFKFFLFLFLK